MALIDLPTLNGTSRKVEATSIVRITRQFHPTGCPDYTRVDMPGDSQLCSGRIPEIATLARGGGATLVELTAPDGTRIFLNASAITDVRSSDPASDPAEAKSVIIVGGRRQAVQEDKAAIDGAVAAA